MLGDCILNGVHIGEHGFEPENLINEIKTRCIDRGHNFICLRPMNASFDQEYYITWAKYLAEHHIYFALLYAAQFPPDGEEIHIRPETVCKVKEIAGEYFLGDTIGEPGSMYASKAPGYYLTGSSIVYREALRNFRLRFDFEDMQQANDAYVETVSHFVDVDKRSGMPHVLCVESSAFIKHDMKAGVDIPVLETLPACPDYMVSNLRGTARASRAKIWGTYFAHEWYSGFRHDDILKRKRLELGYKYCYLAGSRMFLLESGDEGISSYGQTYDASSGVCQNYRDVLGKMQKIFDTDKRPAGGPKVKVAFVSGLYDGCAGKWGRSSLYNQFYREDWGYGAAEHSWMLLDEIGTKRCWDEGANYGDMDYSAAPAYGLYDIVPIEADLDVLSGYDYLIFLGWNSMTEENMDKLTEYVRRGGHLLMTAAHMNMQTKRGGEYKLPSGEKVEALFGCRFMGETRRTNNGVKFLHNALDPRLLYPTHNPMEREDSGGCDPMYSAGYTNYLRFALCGGKAVAFVGDSFLDRSSDLPAVIENSVGKGFATLVTTTSYPGDNAVRLLYRVLVREMISASARQCDIRVIGNDRLRYAVYEGDRLYLLNTDFDLPITVKIMKDKREQVVSLDALELKIMEI